MRRALPVMRVALAVLFVGNVAFAQPASRPVPIDCSSPLVQASLGNPNEWGNSMRRLLSDNKNASNEAWLKDRLAFFTSVEGCARSAWRAGARTAPVAITWAGRLAGDCCKKLDALAAAARQAAEREVEAKKEAELISFVDENASKLRPVLGVSGKLAGAPLKDAIVAAMDFCDHRRQLVALEGEVRQLNDEGRRYGVVNVREIGERVESIRSLKENLESDRSSFRKAAGKSLDAGRCFNIMKLGRQLGLLQEED